MQQPLRFATNQGCYGF